MSRKNKPRYRAPRRIRPFPIVALGAVLFVAAAFLILRPPPAGEGGTPRLTVDAQRIDYGYVKLGETRTIDFVVTNVGDGTLRFTEQPYIEVLQGCCPPELSVGAMVLAPGESTHVTSPPFMMHEGMDGPHNFGIHLLTNDPMQGEQMVNLISDWGP